MNPGVDLLALDARAEGNDGLSAFGARGNTLTGGWEGVREAKVADGCIDTEGTEGEEVDETGFGGADMDCDIETRLDVTLRRELDTSA